VHPAKTTDHLRGSGRLNFQIGQFRGPGGQYQVKNVIGVLNHSNLRSWRDFQAHLLRDCRGIRQKSLPEILIIPRFGNDLTPNSVLLFGIHI